MQTELGAFEARGSLILEHCVHLFVCVSICLTTVLKVVFVKTYLSLIIASVCLLGSVDFFVHTSLCMFLCVHHSVSRSEDR